MGYVRRRDEIATEKIAAAARRTIPEGSRTTFVAVRTMWAAEKGEDSARPAKPQERL